MGYAGRVAVVTGATGSMGTAVARRLAATGAAIACLGRRTDAGKAVAAGIRAGTRTVGQQLIVSLRQDR